VTLLQRTAGRLGAGLGKSTGWILKMLTGRGREHHGEILCAVAILADTGALRPVLDSRHFGLAAVADAHAAVENGTAAGKVVVDIEG
jgi:NADPH:quinone reductase-like Zn-dependent oxidoreductase